MSKFKLTQTAAEVQNILNNSLQKPTGLAKTKLVGVGVNGQENIEIGDNLTLANGKLSASGGGGSLPSTIEFDKDGNRKVNKNLGVDGKLTLNSLVSASNPDGDITKELGGSGGGSQIHGYSVIVNGTFHYEVYTTKDYNLELRQETTIRQFFVDDNYAELRQNGHYPAVGYYRKSFDGSDIIVNLFEINNGSYYIDGYNMTKSKYEGASITPGYSSVGVIQLF